jgi:hypothetical protein
MDGQTDPKNTGATQAGQADNTTLPAGSPPASTANAGTPATPKTYTEEDINKAVQAALTKAGRTAAKERDIEAREAKLKEAEEAREAAELESVKNDPSKLDVLKEKQRIRKERAELEQAKALLEAEKTQHAERLTKAEQFERQQSITVIATEFKGDAKILTAKADELGITDPARIKALAKTLWPGVVVPANTQNPNPAIVFNGVTNGGGVDTSKLSPMGKILYAQEHPKVN